MGPFLHPSPTANAFLKPFTHWYFVVVFLLTGSVQQLTAGASCTPVKIISVTADDESGCERSDGNIQIAFSDKSDQASTYRVNLEMDGRPISFEGFTQSPILLEDLYPGNYNNITITRLSNSCPSVLWTQNYHINFGCDFEMQAQSRSTCPNPISFTDCDGNNQTLSSLPQGTYTNLTNGVTNCFVHTDMNCNVDEVFRAKCIEGNSSTPPLPAGTVVFTEINYVDAGITALEASRLNWIIENYYDDIFDNAVSQAIWHILGTGTCSNPNCQSIIDAAETAIQSPNGTESLLRFFQPSVSNIQIFVEWEFYPPTCDNVTDAGQINNSQTLCGIPANPALLGSTTTASGGTGALYYLWLSSTIGCPDDLTFAIPGATGLTYDPGPITESTWFVRCARREGCTIWVESNCIYVDVNPNVDAGVLVTSNYNGSQISCVGASDGEATVIPIVGTLPFEYEWSNGQTTALATGLSAGTYTVTVTDDKNCTVVKSVTLIDPQALSVVAVAASNYNGAQISCPGADDGIAIVNVSGGAFPYTYSWSNGTNTQQINNLSPGTYTVTVTDANSCSATTQVALVEPAPLTCTASVTSAYFEGVQISAFGGNDGVATASGNGGTGSYTYQWNDANSQTTQNADNLMAGTYTVQISDANSCTCSATVTLTDPAKVGDKIFEDLNGNGSQDIGEPGVQGVGITLTGTAANGAAITRSTATDQNGMYIIDGLLPGTYKITINIPAGFQITYPNEGGNETNDSDIDPNNGMSDIINLSNSQYYPDLDGGLIRFAAIGNYTFLDCNKNGIQDNGESALGFVPISLNGATGNGTPVNLSTSSLADGSYAFINLKPGTYTLRFDFPAAPTGLDYAPQQQGTDPAKDSDVSDLGLTNPIVLKSNETNNTIDAGFMDVGIPTIVNAAADLTVPCDLAGNLTALNAWLNSNAGATASDNYSAAAAITWSNNFSQLSDGCGASGTTTVTFTATDECGNSNQTTATFTIVDTTPPSIGIPASNLVVECDGNGNSSELSNWLNAQGGAGATDLCGNVGWSNNYTTLSDDCGATGSAMVTFTATDECGNTAQTTAIFTVEDNTAPVIVTPAANLTVECDGQGNQINLDFWLNGNAGALATDVCGGPISWTNNFSAIGNDCGDTGATTVTFTATDDCGNTSQTTATFTIVDTTAPSIGIPANNLVLECDGNGNSNQIANWLNANGGGAGAIDLCGNVNWSNNYTALSNGCGATGSTEVTFTATDECGNTSQTTATITVTDNTAPTIASPAQNLTVECDGQGNQINLNFWLSSNAGALAADICSQNISWTNNYNNILADCGGTGATTVTFTATDECGNSNQTTATFTIVDTTPPNIGIPASNMVVQCDGNGNTSALSNWLNTQGGAGATDLCGNLSWSNNYTTLSDDCGATGSATVTFTATDECGNTAQTTATFTVEDNTAPAIVTPAANLTVECDGQGNQINLNFWLNGNAGALATDVCGGPISWMNNFTAIGNDCGDTGTATVTFTATDDCGNTSQTTATFTIVDTTAPSIGIPANNLVLECDGNGNSNQIANWLNANGGAGATDLCGNVNWSNNYTALSNGCGATGSTEVTFTATDECGNTSQTTATITVTDTTAPTIASPAQNLTVECDGQGNQINLNFWLNSNAGALAADICSQNISWTNNYNNILADCGGTGATTVTFTATDECGNSNQTTATFTIVDTTSPNIGIPASNMVVQCDGNGNSSELSSWLNAQGGAGATDLCGNVGWSNNYTTLSDDCGATGSAMVTFTATDECGNTAQTTAIFTVEDNTAPVIVTPAANLTVECDGQGNQINLDFWLNGNAGALATDVCGGSISWTNNFTAIGNDCGDTGTATVIFTATDDCGNTNQTTATFTIVDTTAPSIGIPANNLVLECDGNGNSNQIANWLNANGGAGATDLCGNVNWSNNYTALSNGCGATGSTEVTFTATDECGNTSQTTATITVTDNTAPTIASPAQNLTVECDGQGNQINLNFWLNSNAGALAADICSQNISWINNYNNILADCGGTGAATVTFTATDECGNSSQTTATFTIVDTTPPSIGIPASNLVVECDGNGNSSELSNWLNTQGGAGATDLCGNIGWSNNYTTLSDDCGATGSATVTFTATDECGNTAQTTATFTVEDNTAPAIVTPAANLTVECDGQGNQINLDFWLNGNAGALATDVCGGSISWTNNFTAIGNDCGDTGTATVSFTATDDCGNTSQTTATFTIVDTTAPSIGIPANNLVLECDGNGNSNQIANWLNANGGAGAIDLCGNVNWSNNYTALSNGCGATGSTEVTFTATDECGNTSQTTATITVTDNTAPTIASPAQNLTVECDGQGNQINLNFWLNSNAGALAADICSQNISWTNNYNNILADCGGTGAATVTFTATDECGNSNQTTATFTIVDTTPPSIGIPASNLLVECDGNGNSSELSNWLNAQGGAGATDLCGNVGWSNNYTTLSDDCGATGSAMATFTATDECGNTAQTTAIFTVEDNTAPVIVTPAANLTVECDGQGNQINLNFWLNGNAGALATDVCGGSITWTNNFTAIGNDCGDTGTATVTFTATDDCGNTSQTTATFTIVDTTAPSIGIPANNLVLECDGQGNSNQIANWLNANGGAGATDLCGNVNWSNNYTALSNGCGTTGSTEVTFTATDECGNTSQTTATITVTDNTAPTIASPAQNLTVECDGQGNQINLNFWLNSNAGALAADICSQNISWTNNYNNILADCGGTGATTVTFTATDECGNSNQTTATFTIVDTTSPNIGIPASNMVVQCDGNGNSSELSSWLNAQGGAGATDLCGNVGWSNNYTTLSDDCGATGSAMVTFTATDECGNTAQTTAIFTVEDNTAPVIVTPAANLTVECDGQGNQINLDFWLNGNAGALATDVCGGSISWTNNFTAIGNDCGDTGTATVTFTATDDCGNTSQTTATFTIVDTTAPSIGIPANNLVLECDGNGNNNQIVNWLNANGGAGATDLCGNVNWSNNYTTLTSDCGASGSTTVTFTATDDCGNTAQTTASISVVDNTAPAIVSPAQNQTVECDGQGNQTNITFWLNNHGGALATDICSPNITWTNNYNNILADCGATGSATVIFTATDDCGNTSETTATFTIEDSTPPSIGIPAQNIQVECDGGGNGNELFAWLNSQGGAGAFDLCGTVSWSHNFSGSLSDECGATGSTTITFTASDECGNTSQTTATFTIVDNTAPTIVQAATNQTVTCDGQGNAINLQFWLDANGNALATDLCGGAVTWTNNYNNASLSACDEISVTFTATDACGNTAQTTASFIVTDNVPPQILNVSTNTTINCNDNLPGTTNVVATDICDANVPVLLSENSTQSTDPTECAHYNYEVLRTWTAVDDCGNESTATQMITVQDNNAPNITFPAQNLSVECVGNGNQAALTNWLANQGGATANDNCSGIVWSNDFGGNINFICGQTGSVLVTFTAADICGNATTTTATLTITDTTAPNLLGVPANINLSCAQAIPAPAPVAATDLCDTNVEVITQDISTQGSNPNDCAYYTYAITRIWLATDDCGNTATAQQVISINDVIAPQINQSATSVTVQCDGNGNSAELNGWLANNGGATATDNCSPISWVNDFAGGFGLTCGQAGSVTVTFLAKDACGNVTPTTATFTIEDTTAPFLLGVPNNTTANCSEALPSSGTVTATDLCDTNVEVVPSQLSNQGNNPNDCSFYQYTLTRIWTATDDCGNTATASQIVQVMDQSAPVITTPAQNISVECDGNGNTAAIQNWINSNGGATATDNCSPVTWANDFAGNLGLVCGNSGSVTVTFLAKDACGNVTPTTATLTISDNTPPSILNVPTNATLSCIEPLPNSGNVTATDNCTPNVTLLLDNVSTQSGNPADCAFYNYEITRTWTATDACGNQATATQVISVSDNQAPQISTIAQNQSISCTANASAVLNAWLANNGGAVATDNCSPVNWTNNYSGNMDVDCGAAGSITVTFSASDACGQSVTTTATFSITDDGAPQLLNVPTNVTISCTENVPAPANVLGNDLCDTNVEVDLDENSTQSNNPSDCAYYNYQIIRTWTATDDCNNTATASQTITITDNMAPQITQGALDALVVCNGNGNQSDFNNWLNSQGGAVALDNCSAVVWSNDSNGNSSNDCSGSGAVTVTFIAEDVCGNAASTTATYTIVDNAAPTLLAVPVNINLNCDDALPAPANVNATDLCDTNVEVLLNVQSSQSNNPNECTYYNYQIIRTWTAIDDCGNSSQATQVIQVADTEAPQLVTPAQNFSANCNGNGGDLNAWLFSHGGAVATDNCSEVVWTNDYSGGTLNDCGATVEVTFTAKDVCGNAISTSATFIITDNTAPVLLAVPVNVSVSCNNIPPMPTVLATDLCDTNVEVMPTSVSTQSGNPNDCDFYDYTITRSWIATDDCGNTASATQLITVSDNAAPVLAAPALDLMLDCSAANNNTTLSNWLASAGGAVATENCSSISWSNNYNGMNTNCGQSGSALVTFTAADACGNTVSTTAIVTMEDNTAPELLGVPNNVTVNCGNIPAAPVVFANDLCDTNVEVLLDETSNQGGAPNTCAYYNYQIIRTWTATDACGNTATASQTITVTDNEGPEITVQAQDITVECDGNGYQDDLTAWLANSAGAAALDNCSTVSFQNNYSGGFDLDCGDAGEVTVVFSAVDICGNVTTSTATFSVIDNTPPQILGAPNNINAECDNVPPAVNLLATDACDTNVEVLFSETIEPVPGCVANAYKLIRTWTATDDCGNTATATQLVTVTDTTPPVLAGVPADVSSGCNGDIPDVPVINSDITATDNCDGFVQITFSEEMLPGNCSNAFNLIRTWKAIDNCGNTDSQSQIISIGDANAPDFTFVPNNQTIACSETPLFQMAIAQDDCDTTYLNFSDSWIPGACPQSYTLVRTWFASDDCGNTSTASSSISVTDNNAPTLLGVPADATIDVNEGEIVPPPANVLGTDDCDTYVEVTLTTQQINEECGYVLIRTWEGVDDCGNNTVASQEITVTGVFFASIQGNGYTLVGVPVTLTAVPSLPTATYSWSSSGGQITNNAFTAQFSADVPDTYWITVVITTIDGCEGTAVFPVKVELKPNAQGQAINSPYCIGESIQLAGEGGNQYLWTGPNGFVSTEQNPNIPQASSLYAGVYTLTVFIAPAQASTSVNVEVNVSPEVILSGNTQLCFGDHLQLLASGGVIYNWSGPNGYVSNNPVVNIPDVNIQHGGIYYVTVSDEYGCQNDKSMIVSVASSLVLEASNNGPLCAGQTLELYATDGADSYFWTGPNGFTSTEQNPVIPNAPLALDGIFTVTATGGSCAGTAITGVEIKVELIAVATSNSPVCLGDNIELSASGGLNISWFGPNNFFTNNDDPTIFNATAEDAGLYTAIIGTGICKDTINLFVNVNPTFTADFNIIPADCDNPGAINLGLSGGIPPYTFDWADLPGADNPEDRSNLAVGTYDVTIYDASGCGLPINDLLVADFCGCDANAGDLSPNSGTLCLETGSVNLVATPDGNQVEPSGFDIIYVLTEGSNLIIQDVNATPSFTVTEPGNYFIHTLVYDPVTLDLSNIQFGQSLASVVIDQILQGGGSICAAIDLGGAPFEVIENNASVNSVVDADCNVCNGVASLSPFIYDYEWSDGGFGANRNNLCAGVYNITATDFDGCSKVLTITVDDDCTVPCDEPNVLNIVVVESSCGETTGSILIELDQSPANYVYTWNPNQGTPTGNGNGRINLQPGIYIVTISDPLQNDCETIVTIPVGISDGPEIDDIISTPSNCSAADGTVTILPATYMYIWVQDAFNGNSRSDLVSGSYDVVVIDPTNPSCPDIITVQVGQINNLNAEAIVNTAPTCGEANGVVTINVLSAGSGNLTYQWTNGGDDVTENNLSSGAYGVFITDEDSGCTFNLIFGLADDVAPAIVTVEPFYQVSCVGSMDATAVFDIDYDDNFVNPANITITDVGGAVYQNGQLGPGQYCVLVEDGNGCVAGTACFNVTQPQPIDVDVTIIAAECQALGSISVVVTGGNPSFSYNWADLPGSADPQNRFNLAPGQYDLTVTDGSGCTATALNLIVADNCAGGDCTTPPVINDVIIVNSNCDQADGQAIINLTTNFADYTYDWSPNLGQANAIGNARTNLPAGTYTVTITDDDDPACVLIETFSVGNADGPQVDVEDITPSACNVNNGAAILTTVPGLTYNWSDGGFGSERFDLAAIEYQVTVTDVATGCFSIVSVDVPAIDDLQFNIIVNQEPDCNASNGSVTADVIGGSGSYFYSWGPDATLSNLSSGVYVVTVTDLSTGCSAEQIFTLNDDVSGASVNVAAVLELSCPGANDGFADPIIIFEAGFDNPANINIVDTDGNTYVDGQLPEGTYCIIVEDANGCLAGSACFEVVAPGEINIDANNEAATCTTAGSIDLTVSGSNPPYLFDWADLPGPINPSDRFGLAAGLYSVTITDGNGCAVAVDDLLVADDCIIPLDCEEPVVVNINNIASTCGANTGAISITMTETPANYVYTWLPAVSNTNTASNLPAGVYSVSVANADDVTCFTSISVVVGNADGPMAEVVATSPATCAEANGTATLSPAGLIYDWCNGGGGVNGINLPAGICFVTITDPATNCTNILAVEIESINLLEAEAVIDAEPSCGVNNGEVDIEVTGGSSNYAFVWNDGSTLQSRFDLEAGLYTVTVTDLGATGCEAVVIFVLENKLDAGATVNLESDVVLVNCAGDNNGIVVLDNIDFQPGFAFPFTNIIVDAANNQTVLNGELAPGNYCMLVYDANDCLAGSACFEVVSPEILDLNIALMNKDCDTLGTIELELTGGTVPYLYDWADLPGTNNVMDRIGLEAGGYSVTVADANGCMVAATGLAVADDCLLCPSPDTVDLILPVFTVDSFCVVIESCFDTVTTTFTLLDGSFAGSSTDGFWTLNDAGCLFYFSTGNIGPDLDTIYVLANDNGLIDTTCIFITVTQPCFGLTALDTLMVSTFECDLGSEFCLNVPITDIGLYSFTDNGLPYSGGFEGCDFQMISTYNLFPLLSQFPNGPYQLDSWTVNGNVFTLVSFDNLQQLVSQMNIWDTVGGWFLNLNGSIQGGFSGNSYGFLDITHIATGISFTNTFALGTVNIPVGTLLAVDTGYHQIIMTELTTGCLDTIHVFVDCNPCPPVYTGLMVIETAVCDELTTVCTDIEIDNVDNYVVTDNGLPYINGFMGCNFDSLYAYLAIDFNSGTYTLDSWMLNGNTFTMVDFSSLQELVDSMNVWDSQGNWTTNGVIIVGGDFSNTYGELVISQNGSPVGIYDTAPQLNPNGISLALGIGVHQLVFTDTITNCVDTVNIEIICVDCGEYIGPGVLYTFYCDDTAPLCLEIPVANVSNYTFTDNGALYTGSLLGCDFDSLFIYNASDFSTFNTYTVQSWLVNGVPNFLGFFSTLDELVFWMNNVDQGGDWAVNGSIITGGQPGNTYGNLAVSLFGNPLPVVVPQIQLVPNGISLNLTLGNHQVIVADTIVGCLDTINLVVQCLTDGIPDTIYLDVLNGFTDTFCIDISYLPGNLDTIYNFCEDSNLEINTEVFLLDSLACFEFTGLDIGQDTACFAFCDDLGNCDTLYVIIDVLPPTIDTIFTTVILTDTDTLCLDVSELPGSMYTITNFCPGESGDFVLFTTQLDTVCILYTGLALGIDTACYAICDELGYCDTTILIVQTVLDNGIGPVAVDDDTIGQINMATVINVLNNDTLNGTLADVIILTNPVNGTAVVNPDFTITYIPNVDFCGSVDSFEYILVTSSGSDTAFVFIDVYCDELTIYTGFSPNGDGVNDGFIIKGINNFPNNEVLIYNRWGNEVFSRKAYRNETAWQGTWEGKDLPDGTYFYLIDDGEGRQYSGYVQIHR